MAEVSHLPYLVPIMLGLSTTASLWHSLCYLSICFLCSLPCAQNSFLRDDNEPCVHPMFNVIYYLWFVLDCFMNHHQQHWVINALPVISCFVLAASILTFYFLIALSSFEVSHKLLAWDHCSIGLAASPAASRTIPHHNGHPKLCRSSSQSIAGTSQTAAPALESPCHSALLQVQSFSCHCVCPSWPSYTYCFYRCASFLNIFPRRLTIVWPNLLFTEKYPTITLK